MKFVTSGCVTSAKKDHHQYKVLLERDTNLVG